MKNMEKKKGSYGAFMPGSVMYDSGLCDGERMLYLLVASLANREGYCYASNEYLARERSISSRTVQRSLATLIVRGHLIGVVDKAAGNKRRIYLPDAVRMIKVTGGDTNNEYPYDNCDVRANDMDDVTPNDTRDTSLYKEDYSTVNKIKNNDDDKTNQHHHQPVKSSMSKQPVEASRPETKQTPEVPEWLEEQKASQRLDFEPYHKSTWESYESRLLSLETTKEGVIKRIKSFPKTTHTPETLAKAFFQRQKEANEHPEWASISKCRGHFLNWITKQLQWEDEHPNTAEPAKSTPYVRKEIDFTIWR